jgi:Short C-terminal domain
MLRRRPIMRAAATTAVVAGTATAVSGRVRRRQDRRYGQQAEADAYEQQQAYAAPPPAYEPAPAPAAAPAMSEVEQLTALAKLHEQGALTDAEFATEKAKILSS